MTAEELEQFCADIGGCGDGYCIVYRPGGQHINGGCRCHKNPIKMRSLVGVLKSRIKTLECDQVPAQK